MTPEDLLIRKGAVLASSLVYWGGEGMVFVRRAAFPEAWVKAREFRHFRPDDLTAAFLRVKEGSVPIESLEREVGRYVSLGGDAPAAEIWLKAARKAAG